MFAESMSLENWLLGMWYIIFEILTELLQICKIENVLTGTPFFTYRNMVVLFLCSWSWGCMLYKEMLSHTCKNIGWLLIYGIEADSDSFYMWIAIHTDILKMYEYAIDFHWDILQFVTILRGDWTSLFTDNFFFYYQDFWNHYMKFIFCHKAQYPPKIGK